MSADKQHGPTGAVHRAIDRGTEFVGRLLAAIPDPLTDFTLKVWAILVGRRIAGLASEAAFWMIFSLPWLILAFVTGLGVTAKYLGQDAVNAVTDSIEDAINSVLTPEAAAQFAVPVLHELFNETRPDLGLIGLVIALWAGSRAVMTYVQSIMIINGEYVERSYLRRRALSLLLYAVTAVLSVSLLPLLLVGPRRMSTWLDLSETGVTIAYVVVVLVVAMSVLLVLLHLSTVRRGPIWSAWPGAVVALVTGIGAGLAVTLYVRGLFNEASVYGVLATPVALMVYGYVLSFTVLLGAAVNAVLSGREIFAADNHPEVYLEKSTKVLAHLHSSVGQPPPGTNGSAGERPPQQ
ncbi:MAG: YhjD/YihY/BrkB family envelope integrity protein [Candidatus Nanopelagicales bacterium]